MIIYLITNNINKKQYVGQTIKSLYIRWSQHCSPNNKGCRKLHNAIIKYGKDNFSLRIIDRASSIEELNKKEEYWISRYDTINKGYNLLFGGNNKTLSNEIKMRISESKRGCKAWNKGRQASRQACIKMSLSKKGNKNPNYGHPNNEKSILCIELNREFVSVIEASLELGINRAAISKVINGHRVRAGGYTFTFKY